MSSTASKGWGRREFLGAAALLAAAAGVSASGLLSRQAESDAPTERQRELMRLVADVVLPPTTTAGAGETGVGDFVILALAHGLDGAREPVASAQITDGLRRDLRPDGSLRYVVWLERTLDRAAGGDWIGKPASRREQILVELDAKAYREGAAEAPWRKVKGLILTGYYTSETGGARELQYELAPARYDPDVALAPGARAYSSDWTAVDFG